jgi:hypothetical protein
MIKILWLILLFPALVLAQTSTPTPTMTSSSAPAAATEDENAHKAKALLEQAIRALGGQAYLEIQDVSQEGRTYSFYHGRPNSTGLLFWRFTKFPDKERVELTKKRDVAYVYNGNNGYEITFKGTATEDPKTMSEYIRRRRYSLDWVLRRWLKEPGIALFYDGSAVADQKQADQVTILNASNESVTIYIDTVTHLPIKKSFTWRDPVDKERNVEEEVYDSYRAVQGVMTPHSVTRFYNGDMAMQRFLSSVSYNQGLSDSMFNASPTYDPDKTPAMKKH